MSLRKKHDRSQSLSQGTLGIDTFYPIAFKITLHSDRVLREGGAWRAVDGMTLLSQRDVNLSPVFPHGPVTRRPRPKGRAVRRAACLQSHQSTIWDCCPRSVTAALNVERGCDVVPLTPHQSQPSESGALQVQLSHSCYCVPLRTIKTNNSRLSRTREKGLDHSDFTNMWKLLMGALNSVSDKTGKMYKTST